MKELERLNHSISETEQLLNELKARKEQLLNLTSEQQEAIEVFETLAMYDDHFYWNEEIKKGQHDWSAPQHIRALRTAAKLRQSEFSFGKPELSTVLAIVRHARSVWQEERR